MGLMGREISENRFLKNKNALFFCRLCLKDTWEQSHFFFLMAENVVLSNTEGKT